MQQDLRYWLGNFLDYVNGCQTCAAPYIKDLRISSFCSCIKVSQPARVGRDLSKDLLGLIHQQPSSPKYVQEAEMLNLAWYTRKKEILHTEFDIYQKEIQTTATEAALSNTLKLDLRFSPPFFLVVVAAGAEEVVELAPFGLLL